MRVAPMSSYIRAGEKTDFKNHSDLSLTLVLEKRLKKCVKDFPQSYFQFFCINTQKWDCWINNSSILEELPSILFSVFIAALITISQSVKTPSMSTTDEWRKKVECQSTFNNNTQQHE